MKQGIETYIRKVVSAHDNLRVAEEIMETCRKDIQVLSDQFVRELRWCRERKGISLRKLAKDAGISAAYLSDIELGRRPPNSELRVKLMRLV